jgi:hypothetical protein
MPILAFGVSFESEWRPALGDALQKALREGDHDSYLDFGCIAAHRMFSRTGTTFNFRPAGKPATAFLLEQIAPRLQELAMVPMIDVRSYACWLDT